MKLKEQLIADWYIHRSKEYLKEYNRRYHGCKPSLPWEDRLSKKPRLKEWLIRDWYVHRSREYNIEYARRHWWREPITYEQKLAWYKPVRKIRKDRPLSIRTPEYKKQYQKEYQKKYQEEYRKLNKKKPRLTKEGLLNKISLMRKQQWIIL